MQIVHAVLTDTDVQEQAQRHLYNIIAWYNLHPDLCIQMERYLRTFLTSALDRSIRLGWVASLRIIEYSIVKVLKSSTVPLHIATYQSYQRCVKQYSKDFFDMYCRIHRVKLIMDRGDRPLVLHTSVAQLNLVRWLLTEGRACIAIAHSRARALGRYRLHA